MTNNITWQGWHKGHYQVTYSYFNEEGLMRWKTITVPQPNEKGGGMDEG